MDRFNTYDLDDGLSSVLNRQREGNLEAGGGLAQKEESLVRARRLRALLGCQGDLQRLGTAEGERFWGGD